MKYPELYQSIVATLGDISDEEFTKTLRYRKAYYRVILDMGCREHYLLGFTVAYKPDWVACITFNGYSCDRPLAFNLEELLDSEREEPAFVLLDKPIQIKF